MPRIRMIAWTVSLLAPTLAAAADVVSFPIDLTPYANQKLSANFGGYDGNNLSSLSTGEHILGGTKFVVGEQVIQLGSKELPSMPEKLEGIKIDKKTGRLHFLHATQCGGGTNQQNDLLFVEDGTPIGEFRVNYADRSVAYVKIVYGQDVRDWFYVPQEKDAERSKVVWTGDNKLAKRSGAKIRLYETIWVNSSPDTKITTIDYVSKKGQTVAGPFCVAITADQE